MESNSMLKNICFYKYYFVHDFNRKSIQMYILNVALHKQIEKMVIQNQTKHQELLMCHVHKYRLI